MAPMSDMDSLDDGSNNSDEPNDMSSPKRHGPFNPTLFKFKREDYNYEQEDYRQKFVSHLGTDRVAINKQLVELVYLQVLGRFKKGEKTVSRVINYLLTIY